MCGITKHLVYFSIIHLNYYLNVILVVTGTCWGSLGENNWIKYMFLLFVWVMFSHFHELVCFLRPLKVTAELYRWRGWFRRFAFLHVVWCYSSLVQLLESFLAVTTVERKDPPDWLPVQRWAPILHQHLQNFSPLCLHRFSNVLFQTRLLLTSSGVMSDCVAKT